MQKLLVFIIFCTFASSLLFSQTTNDNYVLTETMLDEAGTKKITSVQYYDGLGRPTLSATNGINSNAATTNYGLKQYNGNGQEYRSWLPIAGSSLAYDANITMSARDTKAYYQTNYDAAGRPIFISTPGSDMTADNTAKGKIIEYTTNSSNSVKRYTVTTDGITQPNFWPSCVFEGEKVTDEDGHTVETFKDLFGNIILERRDSNNDTYYVYDNMLHLRYVLSPMYQEEEDLNKYAYQYTYDDYGRVTTKKLPGCDTCHYRYDKGNRMVSSQDGNGVIHFYLYDGLGRLAVQGRCSNMQTSNMPCANTYLSSNGEVCGTGYTLPSGYIIDNAVLEIANYYDNYAILNNANIITNGNIRTSLTKSNPTCATNFLTAQIQRLSDATLSYSTYYYDIKGNIIDKREATSNETVLKTETAYSFTNKPTTIVTTLQKNGQSYVKTTNNAYEHTSDKLDYTFVEYEDADIETTSFSYDHFGRISTKYAGDQYYRTDYLYNLRDAIRLIESTDAYNELLFKEKLYYNDVNNSSTDTPCYNGNISSMVWKSAYDNIYRKYNFVFDNLDRLTDAYYNEGSTMTGMTRNDKYNERVRYNANSSPTLLLRYGKRNNNQYQVTDNLKYVYNGNQLSRITDIVGNMIYSGAFDFKDNTIATPGDEYFYDSNGNMIADLNRGISLIEYDSLNHPRRIQFSDGSNTQYVYTADGRKIKTIHQKAVANMFVAPFTTDDLDDETLLSSTTTEYLGNFIFENSQLDRVLFDGGYIEFTYGRPAYHYYFTDHLGSVRVSADDTGAVDQVNHYYPYGGLIGDLSYEESFQKYKYNGKELDRTHGLDMYDYGARFYSPMSPNWIQMDPLAEKYYNVSPYAYCGGNPINRVDLHGDSITILDMASIDAIYNALQPGTNLSMKFHNRVLIPKSIRQVASNSPDTFIQDLYVIATNHQMVEIATTSTNDYCIGNQFYSDYWPSPSDIDYAKEYNNNQESLFFPSGKTIIGNLGQTLYSISSGEYKRSTNNNIRININSLGNLNQRSCGIAHEFGHVLLYLLGQPHSHSNNADYIFGRQWNVMKRFGYDYLESPTGTVFR